MKSWFLLFLFCPFVSFAQSISGILTDTLSGEPIGYASVSLFDALRNDNPVTGTISDSTGFFKLEKVRKGDYVLRISSIGYHTTEMALSVAGGEPVDLQRISLKVNEFVLDEVVVTGENRLITLKPDKKILTVDPAMASSGESVVEILKMIPEIRVDDENITLKNQSFSIYMNGKPASISRQQLFRIPASTVGKIEVITNPSVKYTPEGLGGIVNIITKKRLSGVNGIAQLAGRTDNNYGAALTVNYGLEKLNFFITFFPKYYNSGSESYSNTVTEHVGTTKEESVQRQWRFDETLTAGFDLDITKKDLATVYWSQSYTDGKHVDRIISASYPLFSSSTAAAGTDHQLIDAAYRMKQHVLSVAYKHIFDKKDTEFSFDFRQTFSADPQHREYRITGDDGTLITAPYRIFPGSKARSSRFTGSFVALLSEKMNLTMDLGADLELRYENETYGGATLTDNIWKDSLSLRADFRFEEYIPGVYALLDFNVGKLAVKPGGRVEYYRRKLGGPDVPHKSNSSFNFYPSFGMAYPMNDHNSFNFNYSRRIERPAAYQLCPIASISDYVTERYTGNAALQPAFSNSFELGYLFNKNSFGINTSLSYMNTKGEIDRMFYSEAGIRYKTWGNLVDKQAFMLNYGFNWRYKILAVYLMGSVYNERYLREESASQPVEADGYWSHDLRFMPQLRFRKRFNVTLQCIYYSTRHYAYSKTTESLRISLYASKTFRNITLSLNAVNIVNQRYRRYMWGAGFTNETSFDYHDRALLHAGILYRFGKETKTRARTNLNNTPIQLNR